MKKNYVKAVQKLKNYNSKREDNKEKDQGEDET